MALRNKTHSGFKILDISTVKYYFREIIFIVLALFLVCTILSYGRNYVVTHNPSYIFYNNWQIDLPKSSKVIEQYEDINLLSEGNRFYIIKIDKADTAGSFFDLKYYYTGIADDEKEYMKILLKSIHRKDLETTLISDNIKFRKTSAKRQAWDGGSEDSRCLYSCFDEKTGLYYVFEQLF